MEVTVEKLFAVIGNLYVELTMLRNEIERLRNEMKDKSVDKDDRITSIRQ